MSKVKDPIKWTPLAERLRAGEVEEDVEITWYQTPAADEEVKSSLRHRALNGVLFHDQVVHWHPHDQECNKNCQYGKLLHPGTEQGDIVVTGDAQL